MQPQDPREREANGNNPTTYLKVEAAQNCRCRFRTGTLGVTFRVRAQKWSWGVLRIIRAMPFDDIVSGSIRYGMGNIATCNIKRFKDRFLRHVKDLIR